MKSLRRILIPDSFYFITCVTHNRNTILLQDPSSFHNCWKNNIPYAWMILPDHFHCIVDCGSSTISNVMHNFKISYSRQYRDKCARGRVWQNRFWDHIIRNQQDLLRHLNYIHYNPVKHRLINDPLEREYSSIKQFYGLPDYDEYWEKNKNDIVKDDIGE